MGCGCIFHNYDKMTTFMKDPMTNDICKDIKNTTNDIYDLVIGIR
jgi:hypothetical protein